jgi:RES domain-containing protein
MIVFRLSSKKFHADLSGKGAELYGGRWNSKGVAILYTSDSRALAFAEIAVHLPLGILPKEYYLSQVFIPDDAATQQLTLKQLPADWRSNPHSDSTQQIGDAFIAAGKHLVLKVPSAVVPGDFNYLVNPAHPQFKEVRLQQSEPFEFDSRIANKIQTK